MGSWIKLRILSSSKVSFSFSKSRPGLAIASTTHTDSTITTANFISENTRQKVSIVLTVSPSLDLAIASTTHTDSTIITANFISENTIQKVSIVPTVSPSLGLAIASTTHTDTTITTANFISENTRQKVSIMPTVSPSLCLAWPGHCQHYTHRQHYHNGKV